MNNHNLWPVNTSKNRERDPFSFANINLLGKCNVDCFFCLGKDIEKELKGQNQLNIHYRNWTNFQKFLQLCKDQNIKNLYVTGQNTDSLLYPYLGELITYLQHEHKFDVGIRTNGFKAIDNLDVVNLCKRSVGYSIHTLNPVTQKMIMGKSNIPDWDTIIPNTKNPRISIVLSRCNNFEFFDLLKYLSKFKNIHYVQVRQISTDTRIDLLTPDMAIYEELYTQVSKIFPLKKKFFVDAEIYDIYGMDVCFWRTIKTSVNSINYFTDGTISDMYFIVEGYLKNKQKWKL